MALRNTIARWLCPELGLMADRYLHMRYQVDDIYRWCGEFPDVSDAAQWVLERDHNHFREIGQAATGKLPWDIASLRERFRYRAALAAPSASAQNSPSQGEGK